MPEQVCGTYWILPPPLLATSVGSVTSWVVRMVSTPSTLGLPGTHPAPLVGLSRSVSQHIDGVVVTPVGGKAIELLHGRLRNGQGAVHHQAIGSQYAVPPALVTIASRLP